MPLRSFVFSLFLLIVCSKICFSQTITFYPWSSVLEISTQPKRTLWLQGRLQGNSLFSSMNTEIGTMVTFKKNEKSVFYFGPGVQFNLLNDVANKKILNGYYLNIGTRVYPFEKYKNVAIAFDISPYSNAEFDIGSWRYLFGLSYSFGHKH